MNIPALPHIIKLMSDILIDVITLLLPFNESLKDVIMIMIMIMQMLN